jgi:ethanolamine utilization protein EutA (predicted chaperonin)
MRHSCIAVIDGDYSNPSSPTFIQKQMQALEQAQHQNLITAMYHAGPITDTQVNEGVIFITGINFHS